MVLLHLMTKKSVRSFVRHFLKAVQGHQSHICCRLLCRGHKYNWLKAPPQAVAAAASIPVMNESRTAPLESFFPKHNHLSLPIRPMVQQRPQVDPGTSWLQCMVDDLQVEDKAASYIHPCITHFLCVAPGPPQHCGL